MFVNDYTTSWVLQRHTDAYYSKLMEEIYKKLGFIREIDLNDFENPVKMYEPEECNFESSYEEKLKKAKEKANDAKQLKKAVIKSIKEESAEYETRINECVEALKIVENYDEEQLQKDAFEHYVDYERMYSRMNLLV